ncbi:MAG: substrate-binding domain-containing protein [Bacteroidia bacterium]|nr:substrate-binding domain-containing protein [Bacteroidia bacterium]
MTRKSINFAADLFSSLIMKGRMFILGIVVLACFFSCKADKDHASNSSKNQDQVSVLDSTVTSSGKKRQKVDESTSSGEIYITVDDALKPLVEAEINSFMGLYREATIHPIYLPGEEAISQMLNSDSIRLAIATRKLTDEEEAVLESQHTFSDYTTIGKDALAFMAQKENSLDTLRRSDLLKILSGESISWKQINPASNLDEVKLVFDNRYSSGIRFLQDSLMNGEVIKGDNFFALSNSREVLDYVREHPESIGVIGFSWISDWDEAEVRELRKGTKILAIEGVKNDTLCPYQATSFKPYQTYLTTDCYPLLREIYTIRREVRLGLGTGFIAYLAGPRGQRVMHKHGVAAIKGIPRQVKFPPKEGAREPSEKKKAK